MGPARGLRSSVRCVLALGLRPRRRRPVGVLQLSALIALLWGLTAGALAAQPPYRQALIRGFSSLDVGDESSPEFVDLDGDGDRDAVVGEIGGRLRYLANTGSSSNPAFLEQAGTSNPFDGIAVGDASRPELVDLDGDLDPDLVVGCFAGTLSYYSNTGSATAPSFLERSGSANPLAFVDVGTWSSPDLGDLDGDGDLDAVVGESGGTVKYFANTGSATAPAFLEQTGSLNPFDGFDLGSRSGPELADLDGDGDVDTIVGEAWGTLKFLENTRWSSSPAFVERTGSANPFDGFDVGPWSSPALADLDGDWDLDAFIGESGGTLRHFTNTGDLWWPEFIDQPGTANPLSGFDLGRDSAPDLVDLDGDGDLDAVVGEFTGTVTYFANSGSWDAPSFVAQTGSANPFDGIDVGSGASPVSMDLDGDGDLDAVVGESGGTVRYFTNTGSSSSPAFVEQAGTSSPFSGIDVGQYSAPALGDLDGDGDLDVMVGDQYGTLRYFANTGSSSAPAFLEQTGAGNPLGGFDVGSRSSPRLLDFDGDGDLDAAVGEYDGVLTYFANTGSTTAAGFVEQTGTAGPFAGLDIGRLSHPDLVDLDGDSDLDLVTGDWGGHLVVYRSGWWLVADDFEGGSLRRWWATSP